MHPFICRVDSEDKIIFVDAHWTQFAGENGSDLTPKAVIGNSLWIYMSDVTTRHLYRIFMHRVRHHRRDIMVPFRCDAPDRRRFMRMTLRPLSDDGVEFSSELLREEPRQKVNLLDATFPRRTDFLEMCSWCKKVKAPDWVETEEGVARLRLFDAPQLPWVSHSVCPECDKSLLELLENE
ncbi:MAG TPA: PAS domain-containing protein [Verrucomicrobiae bacterium]|nr:PAS domain-containing protein [Verrucomicrobiae bacterium]